MEYQYKLREVEGRAVLAIKLHSTNTNITALRELTDEIAEEEGLNPVEHYIIFSGETDKWWGWNYSTHTLIDLGRNIKWREAAIKFFNS